MHYAKEYIYLKSIRKNIKIVIGLFLTHADSTMNKNKKNNIVIKIYHKSTFVHL